MGKWSVSIDARDSHSPSLADAMIYASKGAPTFPLLTREGCARGGDFNSAVDFFSNTAMINPGYFIIAGAAPGEGAVVTRNSTAEGTDVLRLQNGYPSEKPWFLVETNYDHWLKPPAWDDRRDSAIADMVKIGQENVSLDTLWSVMSDTGKGTGTRGVYNQAIIHT